MSHPSFIAPRIRSPRATDPASGVLYSETQHIKALLKRLVPIGLLAILPLILIGLYLFAQTVLPQLKPPSYYSFRLVLPPLAVLPIAAAIFLWWWVCLYLGYRAVYEWRHTVIELTRTELAVYRPRNLLLLLSRSERDSVRATSVVGFQTKPATLSELLFFHSCITASVTVTDVEGKKQSPVENMPDVKNFDGLEKAVSEVSQGRLSNRSP